MDPEYSLQDVLLCHLCDIPSPQMFCGNCQIHLCKKCVGEHLSDQSKEHKVIPVEKRGSTPECLKHNTKLCELHCEQCDIPLCVLCVSSSEHIGHNQIEIGKILEAKKELLKKELKELEQNIHPKYKEMISLIPDQIANLRKYSQNLTTDLNNQREVWYRQIDKIIMKVESDFNEMESKHIAALQKQEHKITLVISEIKKSMDELNAILKSNDFRLVSKYKTKNAKFRKLPPKLTVCLPNVKPPQINSEQIYQQYDFLLEFNIKTEEYDHGMDIQESLRTDIPLVLKSIQSEYGTSSELRCLTLLNDEEIWMCGKDKIIRLYNIHGELKKYLQTKSGDFPFDIAVNSCGDLVYTDYQDRTVNIVNNTHIREVIRLQKWKPLNICCSSTGDLLIVMVSDRDKQTKIVRYSSGFKVKFDIQFSNKTQPLFSPGSSIKYISENRNLDICVADREACAVVVVNQAGKLRFTFTGPPSTAKGSFIPVGITTDSQSRILSTDRWNFRILILNRDGQFLRFIDKCDLDHPVGLCVDSRDILFVAEYNTGKVKKIKYC